MALPTSTIVMAVVTCIPFGLAIKDTINGTPKAHSAKDDWDDSDMDSDYDAEYAREEAAREAAEAEELRLEELRQEKLVAARRTLFGAEVATLGSGFAGIRLGMPLVDAPSETTPALETATGMQIALLANDTLDWISVKPDSSTDDDTYSLCLKLRKDIQAAWGPGTTEDYENRYWINPTTGTRASLLPETCTLNFERYAAPKDWINKSKTSLVPVALVGQPLAKLKEHIGTRSDIEDGEPSVRWLGLGVGAGSGEARFEAYYAKGKVVSLTATASTLEATRDEVIEQLTALYGKPVEDDDGELLRWKGKPGITLDDYEGAGLRITVGTVPGEE